MSVIDAKRLTVKYGQHTALENVDFHIDKNEFVGIIGPNGGGKTTLVKTMLGLMQPSSGSIQVDVNETIGYVPQVSSFDKGFPISVMDVILTGHLPKKVKILHRFKGHDTSHAEKVMDRLGISHLKDRQIGQLSGGQQQRVLIARALMNHPTVLVLDEPTASVDPDTRSDIYRMLKELNSMMTIVMITHDTDLLWQFMDRCIYINRTAHIHDQIGEKKEIKGIENCPIDWFVEGQKIQEVLEEKVRR